MKLKELTKKLGLGVTSVLGFLLVVSVISFLMFNLPEKDFKLQDNQRAEFGASRNNPLGIVTANFIHENLGHIASNVFFGLLLLAIYLKYEKKYPQLKTTKAVITVVIATIVAQIVNIFIFNYSTGSSIALSVLAVFPLTSIEGFNTVIPSVGESILKDGAPK